MSTKKSQIKSGRVMYNWPVHKGGIPPNFNKIEDKEQIAKIRKFVDALLGRHEGIDDNLKYMLVANGLRFFKNF